MLTVFTFKNQTLPPFGITVEEGTVELGFYADRIPALRIFDGFEVYGTPTVNLIDYGINPAEGNVIIKDYSENEGITKWLQDMGVVGDIVTTHTFGTFNSTAHEVPLIAGRKELAEALDVEL